MRLACRDGCQDIGCVVDNDDTTWNAEMMNSDDDIESINFSAPIWDEDTKDYVHSNDYNSNGYRLVFFEPIVLRFNKMDPLNNFWFLSNRHVKRCKHDNNGFVLDVNL